jgi:hypothetical protein
MTTEKQDNRAKKQAQAQLSSIKEMVLALRNAREGGDDNAIESAEQTIREDPLSVEMRSGWHSNFNEPVQPEEFKILLCTGGPAVQILGTLDQYMQPDSVFIQYQDWFTGWSNLELEVEDMEAIREYCSLFYFGE